MADLIGGLLGYMKDPRRSQQMQGLAGLLESGFDRARAFNQLSKEATDEFLQTKDIYGPKSQQVANLLAEGYNPVGMFIGPSSAMFNKDMALKASQMAKKGATPQEIWKTTGTVKGPDGQWRQEISDKASRYDPDGLKELKENPQFDYQVNTQPLGGILEHPELYKAYPSVGDIPVHFMPGDRMKGAYAAYSPKLNRMTLKDSLDPEKARSSSLHETQHAIQELEGFAVGGNARDFAKIRDEANQKIDMLNTEMSNIVKLMDNPSITKQDKEALKDQYDNVMSQRMALVNDAQIDPMQAYGNLMGEAEARLTQRRMDLGPRQRRENFPFEYTGETGYGLDVPLEGLIYMSPEGTILQRGLLGP